MIKKDNYYYVDEFLKYNVKAIFTDKSTEDMAPPISENRYNFIKGLGYDKKIISGKQTHSTNIAVITDKILNEYPDTDGFITSRKDIALFTLYADCLPIYFIDPVKEVIGICHSGWKGTYDGIAIKMLEIFKKEFNSNISDIKIALGIGIKSCCYEVGDEFYIKFKNKFDSSLIKESFVKKGKRWYFDNELFNYYLLKNYGVNDVIKSDICTFCQGDFFSYRKEKTIKRNAALIFFSSEI